MRGLRRSAAALGCAALLLPACAAAPAESESVTVYAAASLQRVPMLDPAKGTRSTVGELIDSSASAAELLRRLGS